MIKWFINIYTGLVSTTMSGGAVLRVTGKRNTVLYRECLFHDGTKLVTPDDAAAGMFIAKAINPDTQLPEGVLRVWDTAWDAPSEQGVGYIFRVPLWGPKVDEVAETSKDEKGNIVLAGSIRFVNPADPVESQTFSVVIEPPVYSDDDPPEDPQDPFPSPGQIVTLGRVLTGVRLTSLGLELLDQTTGDWVRLAANDGQITLTELP